MEVDITEKVKYFLKYGLVGLLLLAFLCAGGVWVYQNQYHTLRIYDAKVTGTLVGVKVFAGGKIKEFAVADGEHVEAGQVLAHVEVSVTEEQIAQLEQTVELSRQNLNQVLQGQTVTIPVYSGGSSGGVGGADLARAEERMNRMNELYEMGAISALKRDEAVAAYEEAASAASYSSGPSVSYQTSIQPSAPEVIESAEIAVRQAEAALQNARKAAQATDIVAPVAGTIYYTELTEGSEVRPGQTILNLGDSERIWLEARLTESQRDQLQLGQLVTYELNGMELQGTILEFDTPMEDSSQPEETKAEGQEAADESAKQIIVKISLPGNVPFDYKPGMETTIRVKLTGGTVS